MSHALEFAAKGTHAALPMNSEMTGLNSQLHAVRIADGSGEFPTPSHRV